MTRSTEMTTPNGGGTKLHAITPIPAPDYLSDTREAVERFNARLAELKQKRADAYAQADESKQKVMQGKASPSVWRDMTNAQRAAIECDAIELQLCSEWLPLLQETNKDHRKHVSEIKEAIRARTEAIEESMAGQPSELVSVTVKHDPEVVKLIKSKPFPRDRDVNEETRTEARLRHLTQHLESALS